MVAHHILYILNAHLLVRNHPERHILRIRILAECPIQIRTHIIEVVQHRPGTCIAETTTREIRLCIRHLPGEISILALEPALAAGKRYHILGIHHVLLVLHVELADAALVGMCTDGIIRNAESYPYSTLGTGTLTHHLHDPSLVRIADGEGLTARVVTVGIGKGGHHLDSLASRLTALESYIDE